MLSGFGSIPLLGNERRIDHSLLQAATDVEFRVLLAELLVIVTVDALPACENECEIIFVKIA